MINEGIARELVNRIQKIRKEAGLEVTDKIDISFLADNDLKQKIKKNIDYIRSETLGEDINFPLQMNDGVQVVFDNIKTQITIKKDLKWLKKKSSVFRPRVRKFQKID